MLRLVEPLFEAELLRELVPDERDAVVRLFDPLPDRDRLVLPVERLFEVGAERDEARGVPELFFVLLEREVVARLLVEPVELLLVRLPERDEAPVRPLVLRDAVERLFAAEARVLVPLGFELFVRLVALRLVPPDEAERFAVPPPDAFAVRALDERGAELLEAERVDLLLVLLRDFVPAVVLRAFASVDAVLFLGNVYLLGVFRRLQDPRNHVVETTPARRAATHRHGSPGRRCPSCQCRPPRPPVRRS